MKENKKNFGYNFYNENEILIQYGLHLLDMQTSTNNVYNLLLMGFIKGHGDPLGRICTTLNKIVDSTGYAVKSKSKVYHNRFREALQAFIDEGILLAEDGFDIMTIKTTDIFEVQLNKDNDIFFNENKFIFITLEEFNSIISIVDSNVKPGILLNTYLILKKYAFISGEDGLIYPYKTSINSSLGMLSLKTIERAINALIDAKMLYKSEPFYVRNKSNLETYVQTRSVYSFSEENFKYTKHKLEQIYGEAVYTANEIDPDKVVRLGKINEKEKNKNE